MHNRKKKENKHPINRRALWTEGQIGLKKNLFTFIFQAHAIPVEICLEAE